MDVQLLSDKLLKGDRQALSKAMTLVESQKSDHIQISRDLISKILPHTGKSLRLGITGAPGVGKSTLIEKMGNVIVDSGKQLAVLTIDPTSPMSGGSILGDKTRMHNLSVHPNAFIRPTPSGLSSGGISANCRDQVLLCEAAGFQVIIVETVGTGQGETAISWLVDFLLLLLQPGAGDELQGIKRGIMEMSHAFAFTKSDKSDQAILRASITDLKNALQFLHPGEIPAVFSCSAELEEGILPIWEHVVEFVDKRNSSEGIESIKIERDLKYFDEVLSQMILSRSFHQLNESFILKEARERIRSRESSPLEAAKWAIEEFSRTGPQEPS